MKKLLLFLICIMPFLGIGQAEASSEEPVKKVVLVNVPKVITFSTSVVDMIILPIFK